MSEILVGAEPQSWPGGRTGVLVVHGFTGSPGSMRVVADAIAEAGHTVELPLLPGHGTSVAAMGATDWSHWTGAVDHSLAELAGRVDQVVVLGLSMGGSLTLWLASRHPELAGIVCINPAVVPQGADVMQQLQDLLDGGTHYLPAIGSDIAKEGVVEVAYEETPVGPLLSLQNGLVGLVGQLAEVKVPLLLMNSPDDHVVDPGDSEHLAEVYGGSVERVSLDHSFHVATQDVDQGLIIDRSLQFIKSVTT